VADAHAGGGRLKRSSSTSSMIGITACGIPRQPSRHDFTDRSGAQDQHGAHPRDRQCSPANCTSADCRPAGGGVGVTKHSMPPPNPPPHHGCIPIGAGRSQAPRDARHERSLRACTTSLTTCPLPADRCVTSCRLRSSSPRPPPPPPLESPCRVRIVPIQGGVMTWLCGHPGHGHSRR